jgi:hypothetical protein
MVALAATGLREGLAMEEFALLEVQPEHLAAAAAAGDAAGEPLPLPFALADYEAMLQRDPAERQLQPRTQDRYEDELELEAEFEDSEDDMALQEAA